MELSLSCLLLLLATQVSGQNIFSVLATHEELSTLNFHLNASTTLSKLLSTANNFTFLAPSNTAFDAWFGQGGLPSDEIEATLMYHFLNGGFPTLDFSQQPQFAVTHLDNNTYANVTGGQVVEVVADLLGAPQFLSGNRTATTISQANVLCTGGLIHIIDEVLTLPPTIPVLLTDANLNFFISLLQDGGYLNTTAATLVDGVRITTDVTTFVPNSEEALDAFNAFKAKNPTQEQLESMFNYHVVQDFVGYSTKLEDGMNLKTISGKNLTITKRGNDTFVNGAKITTPDYLLANGVAHVVDGLIDPNNITTPPPLPTATPVGIGSSSEQKHKSVSKVAIGLGVTFPLLFCAGAGYVLFWFLKRRKTSTMQRKPSSSSYTRQMERPSKANLILGQDLELDSSPIARHKPYELYTEPKRFELSAVELDATTAVRR